DAHRRAARPGARSRAARDARRRGPALRGRAPRSAGGGRALARGIRGDSRDRRRERRAGSEPVRGCESRHAGALAGRRLRIAFQFDAAAWSEPRVRWTLATIAPLLDSPWRWVGPGGAISEQEAPVWVGNPANAPAGTAVRIAYDAWPVWQATGFERVMC